MDLAHSIRPDSDDRQLLAGSGRQLPSQTRVKASKLRGEQQIDPKLLGGSLQNIRGSGSSPKNRIGGS